MRFVKSFIVATLVAILASCASEEEIAPKLVLSESSIEVWFDTDGYAVGVDASHKWVATTDCEWITIDAPVGGATLRISFAENSGDVAREGTVMLESSGSQLSALLCVKQYEKREEYMRLTYKTVDKKALDMNWDNVFNANVVSNLYSNGEGVLKFDATLTSINQEAFYENTALSTILVPESLQTIGSFAFTGCSYLVSANIPQRVKRIEMMAFAYCNKLEEIVIPDSVQEIEESAFCGCSGLKRIAGRFASADERCLVIDGKLVQFAPVGVQQYVVPEGIAAIEHDAFYESFSLREITIPASVRSIGDYAFYYCENLKSVYCKAITPPSLGESVFDNFDGNTEKPIGCKIYVPAASVETYKSAKNWSRYKGYISADNTNY